MSKVAFQLLLLMPLIIFPLLILAITALRETICMKKGLPLSSTTIYICWTTKSGFHICIFSSARVGNASSFIAPLVQNCLEIFHLLQFESHRSYSLHSAFLKICGLHSIFLLNLLKFNILIYFILFIVACV